MKVVITGATGNAGTSTIEALAAHDEVDQIVGIARRLPSTQPAKTVWREADVFSDDLAATFAGADAVIHLAWAIQPSREEAALQRTNVEGSRRVFEAAGTARVPALIYASSVGAYSRGPKNREVEETWPTEGTPSSFYSRHKVAVERLLDAFEREHSATRVVRLRPALIFKDEAASEIRRLFVGPLIPDFALGLGWVPVVPRIEGLRFQAVHSEDVGRAYARAVVNGDARGAFNIAAEPPIGPEELARLLDARPVGVHAGAARFITDLSWKLRLQPTPPGWLDMALNVPLMSTRRAREELGWEPHHSATEALGELLAGMRKGDDGSTPPLAVAGAGARLEEVRTGVGGADPKDAKE